MRRHVLFLSTALAVCLCATATGPAAAQDEKTRRESTAYTLATDHPLTPEQQAMRFDLADLAIRVRPEDKAISAVATLTFTASAPLSALVVDLDTLLTISSVRIDGTELGADQWANPEGRLTVQLPRPLAEGETTVLSVAYAGQPRTAPRPPWSGGFVWSTAPGGEPWIATAVQGEGCDLFWPCIDSPQGEPDRVNLHITVPSTLAAPSNGRFLGKDDHGDGWTTWHWSARQPNTYAIALNIGPYEEVTGTYQSRFGNSFPMSYWHLRSDDPEQVQALFAEFPKMLDFFEATVGPYPFSDEKMGVVETPHLGMEHQTINAYGNNYVIDGRGYDWLLQHELAHEWFGNQLTNVSADDMWLHEGLGTYMQPLYARWLLGERYMQRELADLREAIRGEYAIVSGNRRSDEAVPGANTGPGQDIYYRGALVSHSLRMLIGDEAFRRSLTQLVYGTPNPRPGQIRPLQRSTDDYLAIVNSVTGRDYGWFFQTYLYANALPRLEERWEGNRLTLTWKVENDLPFPMPVEVEVAGRLITLPMRRGHGEITIPAGSHYIIDPSAKVLRQSDTVDAFRAYQARAR